MTALEILNVPLSRHAYDGLIVAGRAWPKGADRTPAALEALATGDYHGFAREIGTPSSVVLSSDAYPIDTTGGCTCPAWLCFPWEAVRYERWTIDGRVAHGFACHRLNCRRLKQTG